MTWLQILYVVALYFMLAQALFPYIDHREDDFIFHRVVANMIKVDRETGFRIFCVFVYVCWPIVFCIVVMLTRRDTIRAVTKKLEAMNARH